MVSPCGLRSLLCAWVGIIVLLCCAPSTTASRTRKFEFNVEWKNVTRLCHTKPLLTVNGKYPGPTIVVHEGDNVEIKVNNRIDHETTIHWHGIKQYRSGWADGPAYITQCPIQTNQSYTYRFRVINQWGTLWWHAHFSWQRASVHGAFIIYPRTPHPLASRIDKEITIILGEWWNEDVEEVEADAMKYGGGPTLSEAYTINGLPGPLYPCSLKDTFTQTVEQGKTYLVRLINAALNDELFFAVANHTLEVVEMDGTYTKPFTTSAIMITPGQTTNFLLTTNHEPGKSFVMAAHPYATAITPFDETTTIGFIKYGKSSPSPLATHHQHHNYTAVNLPLMRDSSFATQFSNKLRSLASPTLPCRVPRTIDKRTFLTIGLNLQDCPKNQTCKGFHGKRFYASINNQSFIRPSSSLLESYYNNTSSAFSLDFPENPPYRFNFTKETPFDANMNTEFGTKLMFVPYGTRLEMVFQDTSFINVENHPIHIHGYNFFIVGHGFGNFDPARDPAGYNLVDPPERNTVAVPSGGWAALRFKADNPGIWFIHCHLEVHTTWGLAMGLVVGNGPYPATSIPPPPADLPCC